MAEPAIRHISASFDQIAAKLVGAQIPRVPTVVSLFSGCGGLDLGFTGGFRFHGQFFDRLPFHIVWANDINKAACNTYKQNLGDVIRCGDMVELLDTLPKRADVVIGGFPCQDVSINGNRAGEDGTRTTLYRVMIDVIQRVRPKIFVAENVKGLLMSHGRNFYDTMLSEFAALKNFRVSNQLYNAADYGVPQTRERVFIVGVKGTRSFTHPYPVSILPGQRLSAAAAIDDLAHRPEDPAHQHIWSKAVRSPEQGSRRLKADEPATTIRAECHGNIQFHYAQDRRISLREAARLQSFPDEFTFTSGMRETERQVGNAVPPVLAWHIARAVRECLAHD
jgi:DNA (cytosine-5)-methyltransferase 1